VSRWGLKASDRFEGSNEAVATLWKSKAGDAKAEVYGSGRGTAWYPAKLFPSEDTRYGMGGLEYIARSLELSRPWVPEA